MKSPDSWGLKKTTKIWLASLKDKFEFVIFILSNSPGGMTGGMFMTNQAFYSSGLYTRGNPIKTGVATYSTIQFIIFRTSNSENLEYFAGMKAGTSPIKGYKFSKDIMTIDPEMLPFIKTELVKQLDYKIENFLTGTFLVPQDAYDALKLSKTE